MPDGHYSPKNKRTVTQTRHSTRNPKTEEMSIHANSTFEQIVNTQITHLLSFLPPLSLHAGF